MEAVLEWIKGIVILFVVLAALLQLVPKVQYKKYIRFFMEMVIVIAVIQPVTGIVSAGADLDEKIECSQFMQEIENMRLDVQKLDFLQQDYRKEEYETAIAQDICGMAEGKAYEIRRIEVALSDSYELETVELTLGEAREETGIVSDVEISDISIGEAAHGENLAKQTMLTQGARELTSKIMSFYQIEEEQIFICLEE